MIVKYLLSHGRNAAWPGIFEYHITFIILKISPQLKVIGGESYKSEIIQLVFHIGKAFQPGILDSDNVVGLQFPTVCEVEKPHPGRFSEEMRI